MKKVMMSLLTIVSFCATIDHYQVSNSTIYYSAKDMTTKSKHYYFHILPNFKIKEVNEYK